MSVESKWHHVEFIIYGGYMKSAQTHEHEQNENKQNTFNKIYVREITVIDNDGTPKVLIDEEGVEVLNGNGSAKILSGLFGGTIVLDYLNENIHSRLTIQPDWRGFDIVVRNAENDTITLKVDIKSGEVCVVSEYEDALNGEEVRTKKNLFKTAEIDHS